MQSKEILNFDEMFEYDVKLYLDILKIWNRINNGRTKKLINYKKITNLMGNIFYGLKLISSDIEL